MLEDPPRSPTLDLLIGIVGLWLAAGFLWDSWAHLHVGIETFFTPYHDVFYCAMLAGSIIVGIAARRNYTLGYRGRHVLHLPYQRALLGIPIFFLGGIGDFFWHEFVGVENRIEAVTSPTHLIIGFGVVTVLSGPIRSALAAPARLRSLRDQLPLIFALAACSEFVHLGMSYAFDPSAARAYAPPNGFSYSADYFTATAIVLYKTGTGVMIVILESIALMGFAVWMASRFALAPGAMTLFILLADGMIATALGIWDAAACDPSRDGARRRHHRRRADRTHAAGTIHERVADLRHGRAGSVFRHVFRAHDRPAGDMVELESRARDARVERACRRSTNVSRWGASLTVAPKRFVS